MNEKKPALTEAQEKQILDSGEEILWRHENFETLSFGQTILHFLFVVFILVPLVGLTVSFIISTMFSARNLLVQVVLGILFASGFFYVLTWLTRYIFHTSFYITNKRLILLESTQRYGVSFLYGIEPTYSDITDIENLKSLNKKKGDYSVYLLKTNIYKYFFGIRSPKLWKTYRYVYLDDSALEVLNKLIKEKSLNNFIK
jgi:hypothetical protein